MKHIMLSLFTQHPSWSNFEGEQIYNLQVSSYSIKETTCLTFFFIVLLRNVWQLCNTSKSQGFVQAMWKSYTQFQFLYSFLCQQLSIFSSFSLLFPFDSQSISFHQKVPSMLCLCFITEQICLVKKLSTLFLKTAVSFCKRQLFP